MSQTTQNEMPLVDNAKNATVSLGVFRGRQVLITKTTQRVQRQVPRQGLDNQRIRFNWGYHDGASDQRNGRKSAEEMTLFVEHHFDRAYADGLVAGIRDQVSGKYANNSQAAWEASGRVDDFQGWRA